MNDEEVRLLADRIFIYGYAKKVAEALKARENKVQPNILDSDKASYLFDMPEDVQIVPKEKPPYYYDTDS